jgi:hypothetical protein
MPVEASLWPIEHKPREFETLCPRFFALQVHRQCHRSPESWFQPQTADEARHDQRSDTPGQTNAKTERFRLTVERPEDDDDVFFSDTAAGGLVLNMTQRKGPKVFCWFSHQTLLHIARESHSLQRRCAAVYVRPDENQLLKPCIVFLPSSALRAVHLACLRVWYAVVRWHP